VIKRLLAIGVEEYRDQSLPTLGGPINDLNAISTTLRFESKVSLFNETANKNNILKKMRWLTEDTTPGDAIVFFFSGHGSTVPNSQEDDQFDEVLCPYDFNEENGIFIRDDEFAGIFDSLPPGVVCDIILDCCFSGGMDRAVVSRKPEEQETAAKFLPGMNDLRGKKRGGAPKIRRFLREKTRSRGKAAPEALPYALWCACLENRKAFEGEINGKRYGLFTYHFCQKLKAAGGGDSRQIVLGRIRPELHTQTPILYGDPNLLNSSVQFLRSP
jgi:metacaspase-1